MPLKSSLLFITIYSSLLISFILFCGYLSIYSHLFTYPVPIICSHLFTSSVSIICTHYLIPSDRYDIRLLLFFCFASSFFQGNNVSHLIQNTLYHHSTWVSIITKSFIEKYKKARRRMVCVCLNVLVWMCVCVLARVRSCDLFPSLELI